MLQSRKYSVKDRDGTESSTYLKQQFVYKTAGNCRKLLSALGRRGIDVRPECSYMMIFNPFGSIRSSFQKEKEKKRKVPVDRQREQGVKKHTDGERVEQGPCVSGFSVLHRAQELILSMLKSSAPSQGDPVDHISMVKKEAMNIYGANRLACDYGWRCQTELTSHWQRRRDCQVTALVCKCLHRSKHPSPHGDDFHRGGDVAVCTWLGGT